MVAKAPKSKKYKPDFNKRDSGRIQKLHNEYIEAYKVLKELEKSEPADSPKLLKYEEIVSNLSKYR